MLLSAGCCGGVQVGRCPGGPVQNSTVQYSAVQVVHSAVQYSTGGPLQYSAVQVMQYSTVHSPVQTCGLLPAPDSLQWERGRNVYIIILPCGQWWVGTHHCPQLCRVI